MTPARGRPSRRGAAWRGILLLAGVASLSLAAAPWRAAPAGDVVVGVVGPASPPGPEAALAERRMLELFADMVNGGEPMVPGALFGRLRGLPGIGRGARLRLAFAEPAAEPRRARLEVERLVTEARVHAILGTASSAVTAATSEAAERFGVPYLAAEAPAPGLTRRGFSGFFRAAPHEEHLGQALFDFLAEFQQRHGLRLGTVALAGETGVSGHEATRLTGRLARKYGYRVLADVAHGRDGPSRAAAVRQLEHAGADVWILEPGENGDPLVGPASGGRQGSPRLILTLDRGGGAIEGALSPASFPADGAGATPLARALRERYRTRAGRELDERPALAFTGLAILVDAINRAGSPDPRAIRAALVRTALAPADLVLPWSGVRFDEAGQNVGVRPIVVQREAGRVHTVWPFALATREVAAPVGPAPAPAPR